MRFDKNVDVEVKRACKEYVQWLKSIYRFPVRVPIYFKETKYIKNIFERFSFSCVFWTK